MIVYFWFVWHFYSKIYFTYLQSVFKKSSVFYREGLAPKKGDLKK